jgi:hypothetical protein
MKVKNSEDIAAYNNRFDSAERKWTAGVAVGVVGVGLGAWAAWMHLQAPAARPALQVGVGRRSLVLALAF